MKLTSLFEPKKSLEVEAVIDTGATMVVLPEDIVEELGLRKMREVKMRYANNKVETKPIYGVVNIELKGRSANLDVLVEEKGSQPLIGQVLLELLDLIVEPKTRRLIPNPASPEMPMMEILLTTAYNSAVRSRSHKCSAPPRTSPASCYMTFCSAFWGGGLWKKRKLKSTIVQYAEEGTFIN